jgi:hypothetical protein
MRKANSVSFVYVVATTAAIARAFFEVRQYDISGVCDVNIAMSGTETIVYTALATSRLNGHVRREEQYINLRSDRMH